MNFSTKEPQYTICLERLEKQGRQSFGVMSNQTWIDDPKRLVFLLSRYKFVAKMLSGFTKVLEVGCADAFGSRIVAQEVSDLTVSDFDPVFIDDAKKRNCPPYEYKILLHDMVEAPLTNQYDAIYALDVLEHIEKSNEISFINNMLKSLQEHGTLIIGMPSIQSQKYASPQSKEGHVNCKDANELKDLLSHYFHNVFIFSMNDEVVHTGFYPMANYLLALCCNPRS